MGLFPDNGCRGNSITFKRSGQSIDDLGFSSDDMMLTAHFMYMNKEWFDKSQKESEYCLTAATLM